MRIKVTNEEALAIIDLIDRRLMVLSLQAIDKDLRKLLFATLQELLITLRQRTVLRQETYVIKLKATWCFALRFLFCEYPLPPFPGALLMKICNETDREYILLNQ